MVIITTKHTITFLIPTTLDYVILFAYFLPNTLFLDTSATFLILFFVNTSVTFLASWKINRGGEG